MPRKEMMTSWEIAEDKEAKAVVDKMSRFVNGMSRHPESFVKYVTSEHRTLQQSMFNLFLACMKEWAACADKGWYDGRNEFTVKQSKKIMEAIGDNDRAPLI